MIEALEDVAYGKNDRLIITMPPGSAKALHVDTPIPTPRGWRSINDLQVGDKVFDENGKLCNVTWKSPIFVDRPVYQVATDCGDLIVADEDHEWLVNLCRKRDHFAIKDTRQLASKSRSKRAMIRRAACLELPKVHLPLDPYVLGYWLGDGDSSCPRLSIGPEDSAWVVGEMNRLGICVSLRHDIGKYGLIGVRHHFVDLTLLDNKHVPDLYLWSSVEQRLALLQGLIDSDGSVAPDGEVSFTSTNHRLAFGVQTLARSLGVKASCNEGTASLYGKDCGKVWRVTFYHEQAARLPRKAAKCRSAVRTVNTYIDLRRTDNVNTVCIEVDSPSHLYLAGHSMTPTHNSTYTSKLFPAFFMAMKPGAKVIGASHTTDLAERFSLDVRRFIEEHHLALGYKIRDDSRSKEMWETTNGGEYRAAGVGGSITGFRADLAVVDDPVKSREAAESASDKDRVWNWFANDLLTRLKPGGRIVVTMTRWAEDDLAGRILEIDGDDRWKIIKFPALAEDNDPLGRGKGEALWPEWESLDMLEDKRRTMGERDFQALFQGNPRPPGGGLFLTSKIKRLAAAPTTDDGSAVKHVSIVRGWDISASAGGDWTVGVKLAKYADGSFVVLDVARMRGDPSEVERFIVDTANKDGRFVRIDLAQDPGASGLMVVRYLTVALAGFHVTSSRESGDKEMRARPVISQTNVGNISIVDQGSTTDYFLNELAGFPGTKWDDCVDALSRSFNALVQPAKPARAVHIPFMDR